MILKFEIDTNLVKQLEASLSQLSLIDLIYRNASQARIKAFISNKLISSDEFTKLVSNKILAEDASMKETETIQLHPDFLKSYKELDNGDFFEEFMQLFPSYIYRPDGIKSYIRTNSRRSKILYNQLVGNDPEKHNELMKALKFEIQDREMTGTMSYMKTMINWITQEGWDYYEQRKDSIKNEILPGYGEHFI